MNILIVDDAPMILNLLDATLSMADHEVTQAKSPKEAIEHVKTSKFDIGIFDVNMPGMTGIELISVVKAMENGKDLKIVILTTESSDELRNQAKTAGAKAWIVKPFKNDELLQLIDMLSK
jgi:two-component system, chemotaxis family, chemotaxis protein CheY